MIQLIKQPNLWSCLPASFAMVLRINFDALIKLIGHDGSTIISNNNLIEPFNRRGFHIQELVDASFKLNKAVITIEALPSLIIDNNIKPNNELFIFNEDKAQKRLMNYLEEHDGVLTGTTSKTKKSHAVAWNSKKAKIYDPNFTVYDLDQFNICSFHLITKINNPSPFQIN